MSVCLSACLPACLPASLPACLPACLPAYLPTCLPACLPACLPLYPSVCLYACPHGNNHVQAAAIEPLGQPIAALGQLAEHSPGSTKWRKPTTQRRSKRPWLSPVLFCPTFYYEETLHTLKFHIISQRRPGEQL